VILPKLCINLRAALCAGLAMAILLFAETAWTQNAKPFYEGKTIQMVVASGPGASTDLGARLVGRFIGKHVPGSPNVIVQNMPGAGGLVAANRQTRRADAYRSDTIQLFGSDGR
jgi:tripartite-type tricarboxylate transporter receptor subunit TctC